VFGIWSQLWVSVFLGVQVFWQLGSLSLFFVILCLLSFCGSQRLILLGLGFGISIGFCEYYFHPPKYQSLSSYEKIRGLPREYRGSGDASGSHSYAPRPLLTRQLREALFLGKQGALDQNVWAWANHLGISHLLVISGLHFEILILLALVIWRFLLRYTSFSRRLMWVYILLSLTLLVFLGVCDAGVSLWRAGIMSLVIYGLMKLYPSLQRINRSNLLALLGIIFLIVKPSLSLSRGYIFSFSITAMLLHFSRGGDRYPAWKLQLLIGVLVYAVSSIYLSDLSGLSFFLNLFMGIVFTCFIPISIGLGAFHHSLDVWLTGKLEKFFQAMEWMSGASQWTDLPLLSNFQAFFVLGIMLSYLYYRSWNRLTVVLLGAIVSIGLVAWLPSYTQNDSLVIDQIDVGQGDAYLISTRDFKILIDGGQGRAAYEFLRSKEIREVSIWVLSHFDRDHSGYFSSGLWRPKFQDLIIPKLDQSSTSRVIRNEFLQNLSSYLDSDFVRGERCYSRYCLWFWSATQSGSKAVANKDSLCLLIYEKQAKRPIALFLGDLRASGERALVNELSLRRWSFDWSSRLPILKLAHHGSNSSSSSVLLRFLQPNLTLIPAGRQNHYMFPRMEVIRRLQAWTTNFIRSDAQGNRKIIFDF